MPVASAEIGTDGLYMNDQKKHSGWYRWADTAGKDLGLNALNKLSNWYGLAE